MSIEEFPGGQIGWFCLDACAGIGVLPHDSLFQEVVHIFFQVFGAILRLQEFQWVSVP